ncbi:hypothetical protein ACNI3K_08925 [Demequina sp. SO4-13]|uniref:hypothetical protein n=1 Tax=Demequina sp. SO4-13 TaxID=3401027 RepID=UPI003AF83A68
MRVRRGIMAGLLVTVMATAGVTATAVPEAGGSAAIAMMVGGVIGTGVVWVVLKLLQRGGQASRES